MTTTHEPATASHTEEHAHPGPRRYVQIAIILAVLTALEVAISYMGLPAALTVITLLVLATIKFSMVVMYFMHLRFDNRLFTVMFAGGLALALVVFVAVLTIQRVFFA
ncbi:MAG: cytochrome C oxidase subunit IV family protein [Dehalococcoidia bacterium]